MSSHSTLEMRPGRRSRRQAERRKRFLERLFVSFALTATALVLVLLFGQSSEPPTVTATLPDEPTEEEDVHGFELGREQVLAPVAAERPSGRAERPAERLSRPGEGDSTGEPVATIPAIPDPPVVGKIPHEPPRTPAEPNDAPAAEVDQSDPPPPPVTTSPVPEPDEEAFRPPIDAVCWDGWTYDESRRECIREDELEPSDKNEDGEEAAEEEEEQPEETTEPGVGNDLGGGITKGTGSVIEKGSK